METPMSLGSNREICHCKKVTYLDIEKALHENEKFSDVEKAFVDGWAAQYKAANQ